MAFQGIARDVNIHNADSTTGRKLASDGTTMVLSVEDKAVLDAISGNIDISLSSLAAALENISLEPGAAIGLRNIANAQVDPATIQEQQSSNTKLDALIAKDFATQTTLLAVKTNLDQLTFSATRLLVDGSGVTQPVSGPLTDAQLRASAVPVSGTVTANAGTGPFPVSDNAGSLTVDAPVGTPLAVRLSDGTAFLTTTGGRLSVDGSGVTQPMSAVSLPLPTGAATSANQTTEIASLSSIDGKLNSLGQKTMAASAPVTIASDQSTLPVRNAPAAAAVLSNVASSATNVTLLASNASRRMATIFNDSTSNLFVKFGATASSTSFTVRVAAGGYYELPTPAYTGVIDGIWTLANGSARVTELT